MKKITLPLTTAALVLATSSMAASTQPSQDKLAAQVKKLQREVNQMRTQLKRHHAHKAMPHHISPELVGHFVTVTTSPFVGRHSSYTPSDLLEQTSTMNEDLRLLKTKQALLNNLNAHGYSLDRALVQVSGGIEGQLYSTGGFGVSPTDGVNLSTAELDINALASTWASAFMSLSYNGSPISSGNREPNSTIYLKRGFATIGNLNVSPIYGSIGLMYVPFGRYSSGMLSTPLTLSMGRIRTEAAVLGASFDNGLFGSVYGFSGSQTSGGSPVFKQGGVNVGLKRSFAGTEGAYTVGAGWVSNIADAQGQQNTGLGSATMFSGFAVAPATNAITHRVGGIDVNAKLHYSAFTMMAEYLGAIRHYSATDMSFYQAGATATGAEPRAMHIELNYTLPFCQKRGTNVGVAYGHTWEALALNLPETSYTAYLSTSLLKDTLETIEYRHDVDYGTSDRASGLNATTPISGTGRTRNSVIAQVGVYF